MREIAQIWKLMPKIVFSTSLDRVVSPRLARLGSPRTRDIP
jgi:hypothetical protein